MHRGRDGQERLGRGVETVTVGNISGENLANLADAVTKSPRYANLQELLDAHSDDPGDCRCENCKWWEVGYSPPLQGSAFGDDDIGDDWRACRRAVWDTTGSKAVAFTWDTGVGGHLFTAPDHACSMWEVKE